MFFTCDAIFITVRNSSGGKVMFSVCPWERGWGEGWVSLALGPFCEGLGDMPVPGPFGVGVGYVQRGGYPHPYY